MNMKSRPVTVRVLIHCTSDGQVAVGIVSTEWQGAVKVNRRLARLTPTVGPEWYPPGVDRDVVRAHHALGELIAASRTDLLDQAR